MKLLGAGAISYLERLPLDRIKIDKAFVTQMSAEGGPRIAELIAQLGLKLGLKVLAEGIEDARVWRTLAAMGVHEGQGFHIARPMEAHDLLDWLRQRPQGPAHYTQE
ncbi:EAL domain-containing protein [Tepidicella xavieri]|uniref:EAL domain-containing protein n=1 Tax=Tepidicella xavieri TaxID=360241 RepID=A0A4R6TUQ7_9BURK|nr:EAL domain-containing protein [Tepidicella xavieri]